MRIWKTQRHLSPALSPNIIGGEGVKSRGLTMDFKIFHSSNLFYFFKRINQPKAPCFPRPASGARGEG